MLILYNKIFKNSIISLLITALILSGLFYYPIKSYGQMQEVTIHHIRLDTAVVFVWSDGKSGWQKNIVPNTNFSKEFVIDIGKNMKNVSVHKYDGSNFPFDWTKDTDTYKQHWNPTNACKNVDDYENNYMPYSAIINSVGDKSSYNSSTGNMYLKYNVLLTARDGEPYDVKAMLNKGDKQKILDLLGDNPPADLTEAMDLFKTDSAKIDPNVQGYLYFVPIITEYDETAIIEIPDPEPEEIFAEVVNPVTVKTGETFIVSDGSRVGSETIVDKAVLYRTVSNGAKEKIAEWHGTGNKGENTGGSIEQTFNEVCTVEYELIETSINGTEDTDTGKTEIKDSREMGLKAILKSPLYTYEGHITPVEDKSEFTVDDVNYSAKRMYAEGLGNNKFRVVEDTPSKVTRVDDTNANIVFDKKGTYNIKLDIRTITDKKDSCTNPIEVRKTPYIEDSLGGVQKQNRRQDLIANIATSPEYPVVKTWIEIEDLETGEKICHYYGAGENDKLNDDHIKTRKMAIVTEDSDEYFTKFDLAFLTKPLVKGKDENRKYKYTIFAKDAKGDTDEVSKEFTVRPDLAPEAVISMENSFLREKGTNIAKIETEDASVSKDGDESERTWKYDEGIVLEPKENISDLEGYEKLSFGTDKIVGFNKTGVGKFTIGLELKDKWVEPTLPEYITEEDYLTGSAVALSEVDNVAPVVSLEPITTIQDNLLLLAGGAKEYDELVKNKNSFIQEFLRNGIDANITIQQIKDGTPSYITDIQSLYTETFSVGPNDNYEQDFAVTDNTYIYYLLKTWNGTGEGDYPTVPYTVHAKEPYSNTDKWIYTTMDSEKFTMGQDDTDTYLYLIYKNKTVILDKKTGTSLGTLPLAINEKNFLTDKFIYTLKGNELYQISLKTLNIKKVLSGVNNPRRIGNSLHYVYEDKGEAISRVIFNLKSQKIKMEQLIGKEDNPYYDGTLYKYVGTDGLGNILIYKAIGGKGDTQGGFFLYDINNKLKKSVRFNSISGKDSIVPIMTEDENGECNIAAIKSKVRYSQGTFIVMSAFNLNTGAMAENKTNGQTNTVPDISFETKGKAYFIFFGDFAYTNTGQPVYDPHYTYTYDGKSSMTKDVNGPCNLDVEEGGHASSRFLVSVFGDNKINGHLMVKALGMPRSKSSEVTDTIMKFASDKTEYQDEMNTLIISDRTSTEFGDSIISNAIDRIKKTGTEFIAGVGDNVSNYATDMAQNAQGLIVTGIKDIKENLDKSISKVISENVVLQKEKAQSTLQVKVKGGTETGTITKNINLQTGKKYYYEYNLKKVTEGNETASTVKSELKADCSSTKSPYSEKFISKYYVTRMYEEDFSDSNVDSFFKLDNFFMENGWGGEFHQSAHSYTNSYLRFTVPTGQKAVIMFDYKIFNDSDKWDGLGIFLDDKRITDKDYYDNYGYESGFYEHKSILTQGVHEIHCSSYYCNSHSGDYYAAIDNLKVVFIADESATSKINSETKELTNDWEKVSGDFEAPCAISYFGGITLEKFNKSIYAYNIYPEEKDFYELYIPSSKLAFVKLKASYWKGTYATRSSSLSLSNGDTYHNYDGWIDLGLFSGYISATTNYNTGSSKSYKRYYQGISYAEITQCENLPPIRNNKYFKNEEESKVFIQGDTFDGSATLKLEFPSGEKDTKYLLQNLRIYYIKDGKKVYVEDKYITSTSQMSDWNTSSNIDLSIVKDVLGEEDDTHLVYRKGQLVKYNIFYSDYENDPSKKQYWKYIHEPFNDGPHPDAAVIVDENGNQVGGSGKILNESIDRFWVDGKYTVQHWQEDNTGNTDYDKLSNVAEITFYVEGTGEAPWITYIKTIPSVVKEGKIYQLQIGVDDKEKDPLRLRTEVYKEGKLVYTHNKTNILADSVGNYPAVITGNAPIAKAGVYDVVCTVRDWSGAGLGTYKFTVVSDGKITGYVNHTEQWNINRKKYNLKKTGNEEKPRGYNVFWSGEKFMLQSAVAGNADLVTSQIAGYPSYKTTMKNSGKKNSKGEWIYTGEMWDKSMINKWGRKAPQPLTFKFTAYYSGGMTKTHNVEIIVDSQEDYWQLHRYF
ncbi:hypothetical protein [Anaerovorax odorimutans]|uniref:hypothetical protein n=1 Tax=Anaerovorax odorimutans TaxID=109327 RepID=UPI0004070A21|nr:hypothetical protein [Anaerovorax odorimutans]